MDAEFDVRAGVTDDTRATGWEDTRGVYTEVIFEQPTAVTPPVEVMVSGALGATAGLMQGAGDDPEEQKKQQEQQHFFLWEKIIFSISTPSKYDSQSH